MELEFDLDLSQIEAELSKIDEIKDKIDKLNFSDNSKELVEAFKNYAEGINNILNVLIGQFSKSNSKSNSEATDKILRGLKDINESIKKINIPKPASLSGIEKKLDFSKLNNIENYLKSIVPFFTDPLRSVNIANFSDMPETFSMGLATENTLNSLNEKVATEETLQAINEFGIPAYDTQIINEENPNNIVITYKKDGNIVATKTIAMDGAITTITAST